MNKWWQYVTAVAGTETQTVIAERAGVDQTMVSRWKRRGAGDSVKSVGKFAVAYGRSPVEAFVAAGYMTAEEAGLPADPLATVTTEQLAAELNRRLGS